MRRRVRAWLEETHGARFELTRHFLLGLFDNEAAAEPGEWLKTAIGVLAVLLSAGILVFTLYGDRYNVLWHRATPALFRGAMREDELLWLWPGSLLFCSIASGSRRRFTYRFMQRQLEIRR